MASEAYPRPCTAGIEVNVERGVAVVGVIFFRELDHADNLARPDHLDRQLVQLVILESFVELCVQIVAPPATPDLWCRSNCNQGGTVSFGGCP